LGEPLTVLDLDDPEIGIRPEDRFAAIPPGPRIVPRRVRTESTNAPLLLLGALVAFFLVGAWLGGPGSPEPESGATAVPELDQRTRTILLTFGGGDVRRLDVDRRSTHAEHDEGLRALAAALSGRTRLVPSAATGRIWLVTGDPGGFSTVQEIEVADGSPTAPPTRLEGFVSGAVSTGLVVERASGALEIVGVDDATVSPLAEDRLFVAAAGTQLATTSAGCTGPECEIVVDDVVTGASRRLKVELGPGGTEVAGFSPDGAQLVVARSDGVQTRGVIIDVPLETVTTFRARAVRRDSSAPLAWSPDGAWLFLATERDGLDAVGVDGQGYRVEADLPPFDAIVTTSPRPS